MWDNLKNWLPIIIGAVLSAVSLICVNYLLGWLATSFLFYSLFKTTNSRKQIIGGLLFGFVSAAILNSWMITVVHRYAQGSILIGIVCWMVSAILISLIYGLQIFIFNKTKLVQKSTVSLYINATLMASLWALAEWIRSEFLYGMPWLSYSIGISQSSNIYIVQNAVIGGVFLLSFIIILFNYLLAFAVYTKKIKLLLGPVAILLSSFIIGFFLYQDLNRKVKGSTSNKIRVALPLASLPPETIWDESNGNQLVQNLLELNKKAVQGRPDLILWSETIVPWTYLPNDDLVQEISKSTLRDSIHFLLGMNTSINGSSDIINNSAYYFSPGGKALGRYDKQKLLTLIEKPLFSSTGNLILPFLSNSGIKVFPGESKPLETIWGKAGILICNESTISTLSESFAEEGVSFIVNMGNDSWFSKNFITKQHFYNCRLRAVETRKDLVINNNLGTSGVIRANGDISKVYNNKVSSVQFVDIYPNTVKTIKQSYFIYFLFIAVSIIVLTTFLTGKPKQIN
ncbi:MAG TPA: apolipoprotein N-acyltransferase [Cytophagales bacterium]|nr:apolipoprotein N-acyltransferase [Cytophagales bacterium]